MQLTNPQKKIFKEISIAWIVGIGLLVLFSQLGSISFIANNLALITAVVLLYVPLGIYFKKREKVDFLDWSPKDFGRSLLVFFIFSLIIFPPIFLGNHLYQNLLKNPYHPGVIKDAGLLVLHQIFLVALPEEFFFRGYFLGRLNQMFGKPWKLLKVSIGPGLLWSSLVFALSHSLINFAWWHIFIFFPALGFGWLREKTGTLTASILFHASCNLFNAWMWAHYMHTN